MFVFEADKMHKQASLVSELKVKQSFSNCFPIRLCCYMQLTLCKSNLDKAFTFSFNLAFDLSNLLPALILSAHAIYCELKGTQYYMQTKHTNSLC